MNISRAWAMPNSSTFSVPPIRAFVLRYLADSALSCDPFARDCKLATLRNDLNAETSAEWHMEGCAFLESLTLRPDLVLLDPPYSPRQFVECYRRAGHSITREHAQNGGYLSRLRAAVARIIAPGGIVLSFGWNSTGFGKKFRAVPLELLVVNHGEAHNDTLCLAEKLP